MRKMNGEEFDQLVSFFDGMARTSWLGSIHDTLKELSGTWKEKRVLDVGCGTGRLLLRGADEAEKLTGVDLSTEMVKAARQNFFLHNRSEKGEFLVGDACKLPFSDETFDVSLSTCVMFLLPEPREGVSEMVRVTKKDGSLAMLNPSLHMKQSEAFQYCRENGISGFEQEAMLKWANVSTRRHRYSSEELTALLNELGLSFVRHHEVLGGLALITVAKK